MLNKILNITKKKEIQYSIFEDLSKLKKMKGER